MSRFVSVELRERWAARSMVLRKWIAHGTFKNREVICELEVDGNVRQIRNYDLHPADVGAIYHYMVKEGHEVPPSGHLLEYSDSTGGPHTIGDKYHESANKLLTRRKEYPRFFLSYRREDSEQYAWRLHEAMTGSWGEDDVFLDQFSIGPGEVFAWTIQQAAVHARAMLALIGPRWLTLADANGRPRILDERDFVHREIVVALDRGTLIVPVLLANATVPQKADLPDALRGLLDLQFFELNAKHWKDDVAQLREHLEAYCRDVLKDPIA